MAEDYLYSDGPLKITRNAIRVYSRIYPIHRIEKIGVRRDAFFITLGICLPVLAFVYKWAAYLYSYEIYAAVGASIFLILLVLVQRGRGGGLAGALGGSGGSSAFGAKAGDTFTIITSVSASVAMKIPASPHKRIAMTVAMAEARMFTRLLPIRIRPINRSGRSSNLPARLAPRCLFFCKCRSR